MVRPDPHTELQQLRRQLQALLEAAQDNERKLDRFDALERRLIASVSMPELMERLLHGSREEFGLDEVELWLLDPESELRRTLPSEAPARPRWLDGYGALASIYGAGRNTLLLGARHPLLARAFTAPGMRSAALLPLIREGVLIGSLHLGSRDAGRYRAGDGTKFLDRLASVAAISIESTLNRERLRIAGMTDGLTGVHNRRYFDHRSQIEFSQALRHRYPLAALFLDIDHFKAVNDGHGHQAGDEVLRQVGRVIQQSLRGGDLAARYGGEEFVVLLPRTAEAGALEVAERIRQAVADRRFELATGPLRATLSVGLAVLAGDDLCQLLARADAALYLAKRHGRNRTEVAAAPVPPAPAQ
jgi:diguanylate cyclase (GGDEF)-like protein